MLLIRSSFFLVGVLGTFISYTQILKTDLTRRIDVGEEMMRRGFYDSADTEFSLVLKNLQPLPSKMAYFYGRNSYHLGKHKRAINWLNKYVQLTGAKGIYYQETVEYLELAEDAYLRDRKSRTTTISNDLTYAEFDCGGFDKILCPVCSGSGVILESGSFDTIYKTCPYSGGESYLSCDEYNQFIKGHLIPKPNK